MGDPNTLAGEKPWRIRTLTGAFDYLDPDPGAINLEDIIAGLGVLRWSGQTEVRRQVLVHSLHVHEVACILTDAPRYRFTALMHDAHEAFVGNVPRPLKLAMRELVALGYVVPYDMIEHRAMEAVADRFGLIYPHPKVVHTADNLVLGWEADLHYGKGTAEAWGLPPSEECPAPSHGLDMDAAGTFRDLVHQYTEALDG